MKRVIKYLLIVLVCFVGLSTVQARKLEVGETFKKYYSTKTSVAGLKYYNASSSSYIGYWNWSYRFHSNSDGSDFLAYCMDPHKRDGTNYKIDRILGESGSALVKSHDIGIKKILELGYNQYTQNSSYKGVSGDDYYSATSIAIRAFMLGLYDWGGNAAYYQYKSSAHANLGIDWSTEFAQYSIVASGKCAGAGDIRQCFYNEVKKAYPTWYTSGSKFVYTDGQISGTVIAAAKSLFEEGVKAAAEFRENGKTSANISYSVGKPVMDDRTEDTVHEHIIIDFKMENFDEEGVIHNFTVSPTSNGAGITIDSLEYSVDGADYYPLTKDVDVSKLIETQDGIRNGSIKIRVNITKIVNEDCQNMSFNVNYTYVDPNIDMYQGAILKETNKTDKQRFLLVVKLEEGQEQNGTIPGGVIECAKEVCDTKLSVPICSDDEDEAISEITANEKIKKCILDNVDDAGNSYQLSETNGGVENDYCKIFCKEDYKDVINDGVPGGIKLNPVVEDVECGGFFQLTSHIEGKKDCYTGGTAEDNSINKEQYIKDIIQAQKDMIEAYDDYLNYSAAKDHTSTQSYTCGSCCDDETEYSTTVKGSTYTGVEVSADDINWTTGRVDWHFVTKDHYKASTGSGSCGCKSCGSKEDGTYDSCCTCPSTCSGGSYSDLNLENLIQGAIDDMDEAYERYEQIIKDYNGCTAAWTTEFPFEQRLKFYYSEYHYKDEYTPYYDLIEAAENEDLYYLDAVEDSLIEEQEVEICKGNANDYYECLGETLTFDMVDAEADEWNYVPEYGSSVYTNQTFTICDENGCESDQHMISDAKFIRKTVKKAQDYITPTVFYQIEANGRVTVNSGYTGNALKLDALINSLPISTSTTGGGIFKLLLEDLGEFYDTGETGRLIDFDGDHENESVATAVGNAGIETFDGEYICYYESPCRPDDCPDCEFICDEDDCYWGDPGSCPDCEFECINCIFNFDELVLNFKPITTVDVTAPDRDFGYNWDISTSLGALELLRDKAELTINEIEEENETIYDKTGEDSQLSFSIRMTADVINYLKDYNENVEDEGGYANDSLTCYAATIDGKSYANIFCYSEVIDYLVDNYENQVTVGNRTPEGSRSDEDNRANSSGYWSLWDWSEPARDENGQYSIIGGPSWK